ncbi:CopG family ribbon-helix-helix protein [Labrys neptuniae]|uniref:CopG family ribbon-helix-helix protein n=1 Tax=Labrys neptuniae TaxID=376174 RepID=A0ABV3PPK3_9HYPH|nr:CopG family ribbon-helix-helix protein [Labrys neptuniae]MDT3380203.1 CopG family ribbon-helix-helix protein [Labrys neptuniae]
MPPASATTSIKLDSKVKDRLQRLADARHRKPHWLMKEAIHQYVEREEKRQAFYDDARKAWDEYQATGLHVTGEEVAAWLETWGTDDEKASPVCHR